MGGLIGAAMGSAPVRDPDEGYYIEDPDDPTGYRFVPGKRRATPMSAVGVYWLCFGILCSMTLFFPVLIAPFVREGVAEAEVGLVVIIMGLPAVQLVASLVAFIVVAVIGGGRTGLLQIGKILLGTVLGTAIGIGVMWLSCIGLQGFKGF